MQICSFHFGYVNFLNALSISATQIGGWLGFMTGRQKEATRNDIVILEDVDKNRYYNILFKTNLKKNV